MKRKFNIKLVRKIRYSREFKNINKVDSIIKARLKKSCIISALLLSDSKINVSSVHPFHHYGFITKVYKINKNVDKVDIYIRDGDERKNMLERNIRRLQLSYLSDVIFTDQGHIVKNRYGVADDGGYYTDLMDNYSCEEIIKNFKR